MRAAARFAATLTVAALVMIATAAPAWAHDPIFIDDAQTAPDTGPYMPDGSISWALYGQVLAEGETRGFEFDLREGDELYISLLIPNLDPELGLTDDELPVLELESPDGSTQTLVAEVREIFDEPFSRTSYVTLLELREPAQAGRYRGMVIGAAPARFTVAIGEEEIFFTETERSGDRPSNFTEISAPLQVWYSTPPGGEPTGEAEGVGIDLEMVEEAMETGGGSIAEGGSLDGSDDEPAPEADQDTAAEPEPVAADPPASASADEVAGAVVSAAEESGSNGWVAGVVVGGVVVVGAGVAVARRKNGATE